VAKMRPLKLPLGLAVHEFPLVARDTGGTVAASILRSGSLPEDEALPFIRDTVEGVRLNQWIPAFKCFERPEDDRNWVWWGLYADRFFRNPSHPIEYFVVVWKGLVQGLMIVGPSKETNLRPKGRLLYLAHMATAPWNRRLFCPPPDLDLRALAGVGTGLVKQAVRLSREYGYDGRLGLRAMGRSSRFYKKIGMKNCGRKVKDQEFGAHAWYEFSTAGARTFLKED
jgi:hypothetical protein